jgi:hypothetical protein
LSGTFVPPRVSVRTFALTRAKESLDGKV